MALIELRHFPLARLDGGGPKIVDGTNSDNGSEASDDTDAIVSVAGCGANVGLGAITVVLLPASALFSDKQNNPDQDD